MEAKHHHHNNQALQDHLDHHGHCHHDLSGSMHVHPVVKNMKVALVLNVLFTVIEFFGGLFTNSVAIMSDAIHDLGDSLAIALALILEKKSKKGRTPSFTYGTRRYSTLASLITSLILLGGSLFIIYRSVPRLLKPEEVHVEGVFWLAVLGLLFNGAAVLRLKKGSKNSLNQRAVMLHLMEDALGWLAVLVGGVLMYFTQWFWIDPLLSLAIAGFILWNSIGNITKSTAIFLQAKPKGIEEDIIQSSLLSIPNVSDVHDLHIWTIDGEYNILTSHIVVPQDSTISMINKIRAEAMEILLGFNIQHPTLQIETLSESCTFKNC